MRSVCLLTRPVYNAHAAGHARFVAVTFTLRSVIAMRSVLSPVISIFASTDGAHAFGSKGDVKVTHLSSCIVNRCVLGNCFRFFFYKVYL